MVFIHCMYTLMYTLYTAVQCPAHPSGFWQNQPAPLSLYIVKIDNSCHKKAPSSWPGFNKTQVTGAFSLLLKGEIKVVLVLCGAGKGCATEHFRHKTQTLGVRYPTLQESAPAQLKQQPSVQAGESSPMKSYHSPHFSG